MDNGEQYGSVIELSVTDAANERIDRWLSQNCDLSRNRIQKLIEQGALRINDQPCINKKVIVSSGDWLQLKIPEVEAFELTPEAIPLDILYEDQYLLVVNKPPGMVVHPAPGHPKGTLVNAVLAHCGDQLTGVGGVQRPGIVHRLDKDTTGAMVVAKTEPVLHHLQGQIQAKTAQREYLGVVFGVPKLPENQDVGIVDAPIGRHPRDRKKMAVVPIEKGGRRAVTHWRIQERLGNYTLVHYRLETGRTHQIRVHSALLGNPIVGDMTYGSGRSIGVKLPGQALHARQLTLTHPITGKDVVAIAPLPPQFETLLQRLRQR
ncbi:RluA family pseudouridine synthase [Leptolyngbyaceae cyanobacterium CCMR0082]|uniref:Pseudouridine synthase n=2 Tax=Adonisia turfae TaxID=2950184 RepID=A0A6M0SGV0_9CYAN|nr:RluA family pseudouridine synthase [Adonisia turfae]MDV3350713.1 RluA family pseudouridine synthase [Leptothoe sp. LEGE 181152]NEZ57825.1 RluA family pseudouridine synthase [Adonisia turfae CCMR0081]NEZ67725.1 RluA family pseudouridine synthase [Adonisia turfae CCMR0082]